MADSKKQPSWGGVFITPLRFTGFSDLCKSQDRLTALKGNFRASPQFDKVKEFQSIAGRQLTEEELAMAMQAEELRRQRTGQG